MTWEEIASLRDSRMHTVILPAGATEQRAEREEYRRTVSAWKIQKDARLF